MTQGLQFQGPTPPLHAKMHAWQAKAGLMGPHEYVRNLCSYVEKLASWLHHDKCCLANREPYLQPTTMSRQQVTNAALLDVLLLLLPAPSIQMVWQMVGTLLQHKCKCRCCSVFNSRASLRSCKEVLHSQSRQRQASLEQLLHIAH